MSVSRPPPPFPVEVHFELLKLLLQVAWADGEVAKEERDSLDNYGRLAGLSDEQMAQIDRCLAGEETLPPPNLGLLKQHRTEVMRRVRDLLRSDNAVTEEEDEILGEIALLLG